MPVTVSRIYDSKEKAESVAAELKTYSFSSDHVHVVSPGGDTEAALTAAGVSSARAKAYAETVGRGNSVVIVIPTFGKAGKAAEILDSYGPIETHISDVPDTVERAPRTKSTSGPTGSDSAAPLSSAFGWKTLDDNPTPLSSKFGWRVLLDNPTPLSSWLGWKTLSSNQTSSTTLSSNPAPLSNLFGWKLLSGNPAPLSSWAGWRIISDDPAPLSRKFGWRVLSDDQTAKASLSDNPTPLSSALGLPVLSKDQSSGDQAPRA